MKKALPDIHLPVIARRMERVSSFLAMDVLSAAAAKERRGDSVVHMEVGPALGACAQGGPRGRQGGAGDRPHRLHGGAGHCGPCASASPAITGTAYGVSVAPERVIATTGSSAGFVAGLPEPLRSRPAHRHHRAGLSGLSQHPGSSRPGAGRDPARRSRTAGS